MNYMFLFCFCHSSHFTSHGFITAKIHLLGWNILNIRQTWIQILASTLTDHVNVNKPSMLGPLKGGACWRKKSSMGVLLSGNIKILLWGEWWQRTGSRLCHLIFPYNDSLSLVLLSCCHTLCCDVSKGSSWKAAKIGPYNPALSFSKTVS
jgi:hypothetical protein